MINTLRNKLSAFLPNPSTVDRFERMRACAGALFGIVLTGMCSRLILGTTTDSFWLLAPMGASAVLLFAVPSSPLAQPWAILGGNAVSAFIGVSCYKLISDPALAAAIAASLSVAAMFVFRCLHPPGGAVALTAVLGGPGVHAFGFGFVLVPVIINSALLLLTALFFNNATGRRYPHRALHEQPATHETADLAPTERLGITREDLDDVLSRYNQIIDISRDDLETILLDTERQAYRRRFGITRCSDIMSRDVVSVDYGTELQEVWDLLHHHRLTALPVLDRARAVIGIITKADFIRHAGISHYRTMREKLTHLLRPEKKTHSHKPEVAGQIMHNDVRTVLGDQPIVELVPLMADVGLHSVPVVDFRRRLIGMISPSDMIAALYEHNLHDSETLKAEFKPVVSNSSDP